MTLLKKKDNFDKKNEDQLSATKFPYPKSKTTCLKKEDDLAPKGNDFALTGRQLWLNQAEKIPQSGVYLKPAVMLT